MNDGFENSPGSKSKYSRKTTATARTLEYIFIDGHLRCRITNLLKKNSLNEFCYKKYKVNAVETLVHRAYDISSNYILFTATLV